MSSVPAFVFFYVLPAIKGFRNKACLTVEKFARRPGLLFFFFCVFFFFFFFSVQGEYDFADTSGGSSKEKEEEMRLREDLVALSDPKVGKRPMQLMGRELQADEGDASEGSCLRQTKVPYRSGRGPDPSTSGETSCQRNATIQTLLRAC